MDLGLSDRVFVVTAGSSGLGRATADALVGEGARVVLVARRSKRLAEAVDVLGPDRAAALSADLSDPDTAARACELALERWDRLDGALISVGGPPAGTVLGTTDDQWREAYDSVFLAALRMTRELVARCTAADLAIAWVLSTSVKSPIPGLAASNGLRPGLGMLVKQLADELGSSGTRVVGMAPGRIETERVQHLDSLYPDPAAAREASRRAIPLGRYGTPGEFGRVAAFLLSPAASYVTGSVVPIEGGALRSL